MVRITQSADIWKVMMRLMAADVGTLSFQVIYLKIPYRIKL
jgi:hypothetical protein